MLDRVAEDRVEIGDGARKFEGDDRLGAATSAPETIIDIMKSAVDDHGEKEQSGRKADAIGGGCCHAGVAARTTQTPARKSYRRV